MNRTPIAIALLLGCSGETETATLPDEVPTEVPDPSPVRAAAFPSTPGSTLIMVQAQFLKKDGKPVPGPAKMVLWREHEGAWLTEVVEDEGSNVFHKGMVYDEGILTIGAMGAKLRHWKRGADGWTGTTLWE